MPSATPENNNNNNGGDCEVLFLYGSQTGNTEQITKGVYDEALHRGYKKAHCHAANNYNKCNFETAPIVIIMISTTGDGEYPDNAVKFARYLKKLPAGTLAGKHFALLAIGDSNYSTFCGAGKKLYDRFISLGATEFHPKAEADDATGLDEIIDPWITQLWPALETIYANVFPKPDAMDMEILSLSNGNSSRTSLRSRSKLYLPTVDAIGSNYTGIPRLMSNQFQIQWSTEKREPLNWLKEGFSTPLVESVEDAQQSVTPYTREHPYKAQIVAAQCLTSKMALKRTLKLTLELNDPSLQGYLPGDAFGLICPNDPELIHSIIDHLGLQADLLFSLQLNPGDDGKKELPAHIPRSCTVFEALSYYIEITQVPKKSLLRVMAEYCSDPTDRDLLLYLVSKEGSEEFNKFRNQQPNLYDLLVTFPSCAIPFERIIEQRLPLTPRYYSAATSALSHGNLLDIVFNIVHYQTMEPYKVDRYGVATNYLNNLIKVAGPIERENGMVDLRNYELHVPLFPRSRNDFVVPEDLSQPIIMIGPGVGIAPFIGFLRHRRCMIRMEKVKGCLKCKYQCQKPEGCFSCFSNDNISTAWIFTGNRTKEWDFLFERDIDSFIRDGTASRVSSAFSRPSVDIGLPRYVQNSLKLHAKQVYMLIKEKGAKIFVCGDALGMGKDVENAFIEIIQEQGSIAKEEAQQIFKNMIKERRYVTDLWS